MSNGPLSGRRAVLVLILGSGVFGCASRAPDADRSSNTVTPTTGTTSRPSLSVDDVIRRFEIDPRLTLCDVRQDADGTLGGVVEMPGHRDTLRAAGFDVRGVRLLPEESRTTDRFGIVPAEHALLRSGPTDEPGDRDNVTDLLYRDAVWILDRHENGSMLVHASDGYVGWVEASAVRVVDAAGMAIKLRDGEPATRANRASAILADARTFLKTPYVWGGKTRSGIDCSGLVQTCFARRGILLPRDADQQANVGRLVATRWFTEALMPGDLLFFVSGRRGNVHHVAIHLGAGKYIEAAGGGVRIRSMRPGDAEHDAARARSFGWARRVIE